MSTTIDKNTYLNLIDEDIDWLENHTERTVERMHILAVLKCSVCMIYGGWNPFCDNPFCSKRVNKDKENE